MGRKSRAKKERAKEKRFKKEKKSSSDNLLVSGPKSVIEGILLFLIYGATYLMILVPLIVNTRYFFPYVGPKGLYLMALIEVMFFSWLVLVFYSPKYRPKRNVVLLALIAYVTILTLATLLGADPLRSFWSKFERMSGLLMWLHLFAFFIAASSVFRKRDWQRFFLASLAVAIIVAIAFFANPEGSWTAQGGSTLGNSSFLATYLLFNVYFALYLLFSFFNQAKAVIKEKKENYLPLFKWGFVALTFVFLLITLTQSKGLAAIVSGLGGFGLIFIFWLAFQSKKVVFRKIGKALLILGFLGYLLSMFLLLYPDSFVQKYYLNFRDKARPLVWQSSFQAFKERPILGWGPQNFGFVFHKNLQPWFLAHNKPRFDQAHNIICDSLVDGGILGFLAYLAMFGSVFWVLWKRHRQGRAAFWTAAIFTALLIAHFTQNFTVFDMPASLIMLFFVFGFAGSLAVSSQNRNRNQEILAKQRVLVAMIIALILLIISLNFFVYKPSLAGRGVIKVLISRDQGQRMPAYEQALHSSPMGMYQIRTHLAGELLKRAQKKEAGQEEFEFISKELEKSLKTSPLDYHSHLSLAKLYNVYGILYEPAKLVRAEEILAQSIKLSPTQQNAYWEMAKNQSLLGRPEQSISYAERAVAIDPNLAYAHLFYVNILKIEGRQDLAVEKAKEALRKVPDWQAEKIKPSFKENLEQILGEKLELE